MDALKSIIPAIATALGGPLAGVAASWLSTKLGRPVDQIKDILLGMKPEDLIKMKALDLEFQKFMAENGIKLDLAQIDVNKAEAGSGNLFASSWRPMIGYICGFSLAYASIIEPMARFAAQVWGNYHGGFPVIDTALTMQVLLGLLGLGGLRTLEKVKNAEGNR